MIQMWWRSRFVVRGRRSPWTVRRETIRVHGGEPMSPEAMMSALVATARLRMAAEETVRQRTLSVLAEHTRTRSGRCACGVQSRRTATATIWRLHLLRELAAAGVLLPLDQRMVEP